MGGVRQLLCSILLIFAFFMGDYAFLWGSGGSGWLAARCFGLFLFFVGGPSGWPVGSGLVVGSSGWPAGPGLSLLFVVLRLAPVTI